MVRNSLLKGLYVFSFTLKKFDFSSVFSMRPTNKNVQKIIYRSFIFTRCGKCFNDKWKGLCKCVTFVMSWKTAPKNS